MQNFVRDFGSFFGIDKEYLKLFFALGGVFCLKWLDLGQIEPVFVILSNFFRNNFKKKCQNRDFTFYFTSSFSKTPVLLFIEQYSIQVTKFPLLSAVSRIYSTLLFKFALLFTENRHQPKFYAYSSLIIQK